MCQHDLETAEPVTISRRGVLASAALLAGVAGAGGPLAATASATPPPSPGRGRPPRFGGTPPVPSPLVIHGGPMLDPKTGAVTEDAVVVLRDGQVLGAGTWDQTRGARAAVGSAVQQVDVRGAWILPGLVDAHVHVNTLADAAGILRAGATTVRSGASNFYQDVAMRPLTTWTPGRVPRMRAAGTFISPILGDTVLGDEALAPLASLPDGVQEPADLRYFTAVNLRRGVDVIKTRANPRAGLAEQDPLELVYDEEQLSAVVAEARRRNATVLCHAYSAEGCRGAVRAGIASLEHGVFVDEDTLDLMARRRTSFTPTMAAITGLLDSSDPVLVERGREYVPVLQEALRTAHAKGVPIVAGTDTFGTATQPVGKEVRLIAEAGIPALDALRGATTTAAALLGLADKVGRLAPGHYADVVAVDGNPVDDPAACERVRLVVAQGAISRNDIG
jgi:imidazolonepropionase-like amidohydrolase